MAMCHYYHTLILSEICENQKHKCKTFNVNHIESMQKSKLFKVLATGVTLSTFF